MNFVSSSRLILLASSVGCALALGTSAQAAENRTIRFPDIPGYRTLKADFHQHTAFSDGKVWPNIRVEESVRDGLDAMAITDHLEWQPHGVDLANPDRNRAFEIALYASRYPAGMSEGDYWLLEQYRNGREDLVKAQNTLAARPPGAEKEAKPQDILVVAGVEITRNAPLGHVNALFVKDANRLRDEDPVAVLREASAQGAFLVWNHPWSLNRGAGSDGIARMTEFHQGLLKEGLIHGIEIANTNSFSPEALQLALDHNLAMFGASDIHGLIDWVYPAPEKHRPTTLIFAREKTEESLREAMVERRTAVWFNNTLIARSEWLEPLIKASLALRSRGYKPDRSRFSIQDRPDTSELVVEIKNASDANFILRNVSAFTISDEAEVLTVPAHATMRVTVLTLERLPEAVLRFEILNAFVAPSRHPVIEWTLATK